MLKRIIIVLFSVGGYLQACDKHWLFLNNSIKRMEDSANFLAYHQNYEQALNTNKVIVKRINHILEEHPETFENKSELKKELFYKKEKAELNIFIIKKTLDIGGSSDKV